MDHNLDDSLNLESAIGVSVEVIFVDLYYYEFYVKNSALTVLIFF